MATPEYTAIDPDGEPLTPRDHVRAIIEGHIEAWVEVAYQTALAGYGTRDPIEVAKRDALRDIRYLGLSQPLIPAGLAADQIAAEVLPLLEEVHDGHE